MVFIIQQSVIVPIMKYLAMQLCRDDLLWDPHIFMPCAPVGLIKLQHALDIATSLEDKNKQNLFQINTYLLAIVHLLVFHCFCKHCAIVDETCIINCDLLIAFRLYFPHYDQADTMAFIIQQSMIVPIMKYLAM